MVTQKSRDYKNLKNDYRLQKAEIDLEFLVRCRDNNVITRFLNIRLANKFVRSSLTYAQFQSNLLLEKIRQKKSHVRNLKKDFDNILSFLQPQINLVDYTHICSMFLKSNELKLKSNSLVQQNKFYNLLKEEHFVQDPEKVTFSFSKYVL